MKRGAKRKDWHSAVVKPDVSLKRALECMDQSAQQILLVTDDDKRLIAVLTDGDLRRMILRGVSLETPIERELGERKPHKLLNKVTDETILNYMMEHEIRHLPLVDERDVITDLVRLESIVERSGAAQPARDKHDFAVFILAGGLGTRLREVTKGSPKPLVNVGVQPVLKTVLQSAHTYGAKKAFIAGNYKIEAIESFLGEVRDEFDEMTIDLIREPEFLGTAGSLSLLSEKIGMPLVVINGDILTKLDLSRIVHHHVTNQSQMTVGLRVWETTVPFGVATVENDEIRAIEEKPTLSQFVCAGIYVLDPEITSLVPKSTRYDMPNLINDAVAAKKRVTGFPIHEYWIDIGTPQDYQKANEDYGNVFDKDKKK